jgi:flavorubredoxin
MDEFIQPSQSGRQHATVLVAFDSEYGNTEKVARALAKGMDARGLPTDCLNIKDLLFESMNDYALLGFGAPTQAFSASRRMKDFLAKLEGHNINHKPGFAFDTKLKNRLSGSGGAYIEKKMAKIGFDIFEPHFSAIVKGKEGPLEEGSEENFEKIGAEIAARWRQAE